VTPGKNDTFTWSIAAPKRNHRRGLDHRRPGVFDNDRIAEAQRH
jgi:hypothetical protein